MTNNKKYYHLLKRLVYDGRNCHMIDKDELLNNSQCILCGYHCYMEPDKAVKGILILNQKTYLPEYKEHSWKEYTSLESLSTIFN